MESETVFLDSGDVKVTNARFVVKGKTYAIASISSFRRVAIEIEQTSRFMWLVQCAIALFIFVLPGFSMLFTDSIGMAIGLLLIGGFWAYKAVQNFKNYQRLYQHKIVLTVASGEVAALETRDGKFSADIEECLTQAIVHRG